MRHRGPIRHLRILNSEARDALDAVKRVMIKHSIETVPAVCYDRNRTT